MAQPPPLPASFPPLIPGLPNDVASFILSSIPFPYHAPLKLTCKSWRLYLSSKTLIASRQSDRCHLSHLICIFPKDPAVAAPYLFDPRLLACCALPLMPCNAYPHRRRNFTAVAFGPHLYVLGGSLIDPRPSPSSSIDCSSPSNAVFRFDFTTAKWESRAPMLSPRGSFACAKVPKSDQIIVAGGGFRHTTFSAAGSRMSSVERYDVSRDEWEAMEGLPSFRARCVGFFAGDKEFWVMGGYGQARTMQLPVDEFCRNAVVMDMESGDGHGEWREAGDMWEGVERTKLGKIAVVDNEVNPAQPGVFMLDGNYIFRYDLASNGWSLESEIPSKPRGNSSFGIIGLDGELYVITVWSTVEQLNKRAATLYIQIYHPQLKTWRTLFTPKSPFHYGLNFDEAVMSTVHL